jgi:hypothetical protein
MISAFNVPVIIRGQGTSPQVKQNAGIIGAHTQDSSPQGLQFVQQLSLLFKQNPQFVQQSTSQGLQNLQQSLLLFTQNPQSLQHSLGITAPFPQVLHGQTHSPYSQPQTSYNILFTLPPKVIEFQSPSKE